MELLFNAPIPDGLLASMTLLSEKPRLGVPSRKSAPHQRIDERNCTAVLGLRFPCSEIVSGTVVALVQTKTQLPRQLRRPVTAWLLRCSYRPNRLTKSLKAAFLLSLTGPDVRQRTCPVLSVSNKTTSFSEETCKAGRKRALSTYKGTV